jgi:hypothetical protein
LKHLPAIVLAAAAAATASEPYRDAGAAAFQFLKVGVSARASAMGGTVLFDSGPFAGLSSPAALASADGAGLALSHAAYLGSVTQNSAAWMPGGGPVRTCFALTSMYAGDLEYRGDEPSAEPEGTFECWELAVSGAAAVSAGPFDLGLGLKVIRERVWTSDSWGGCIDASVLARPARWLSLGVAVQNVGPGLSFGRGETYRMPFTWRAGAGAELALPRGSASVTAEVSKPIDNRPSAGAGIEYRPLPWAAVRAGARLVEETGGPTAGAGLTAAGWTLDYAWLPSGTPMGDVHRIVLSREL